MRAVIQRVASASVTVDSETVSSIGRGLMILVGIGTDSSGGGSAMWKKSVRDIEGDILCVSQFTLLANTSKGNKPDFHRAMATEPSRELYSTFLEQLGHMYKPEKIKDGRFGAMMNVSLTNEGPVTFTLDSRKFEYVDQSEDLTRKTQSLASAKNKAKAERATKWASKGTNADKDDRQAELKNESSLVLGIDGPSSKSEPHPEAQDAGSPRN